MKLLTAGEALVDWVSTERGVALPDAQFIKAPGGAPLNVAIALARLGNDVGFAGRFGADAFGIWLLGVLAAHGVDTRLCVPTPGCQTRMAYVVTNVEGDRELAWFSDVAVADAELRPEDLSDEVLEGLDVLYIGSSLSLRAPNSRDALLSAAARVSEGPGLVVFDPNVRPVLWPSRDQLDALLTAALEVSDLVKVGAEELPYLIDAPDVASAARTLIGDYDLTGLVVTHGAEGAEVYTRRASARAESFTVASVDALGAGDAFLAGLIDGLVREAAGASVKETAAGLTGKAWEGLLRRACAVGALATTRAGAIAGLPTKAELEAFLQTV